MSTIYLLRHGQSLANVDPSAYEKYENENIPLTNDGIDQLKLAGELIKQDNPECKPVGVFSSPYRRCYESCEIVLDTIGIKSPISSNLLLSEMSYGEQEGTNVEDFRRRPGEKVRYDMIGTLHYKPIRGESFLDLHTRTGLFVMQQKSFRYIPVVIIVSHASLCLMMHYFLTSTCPNQDVLRAKASLYCPNAMVRKYSYDPESHAKYHGILGKEHDDILIS